MSTNKRAFKVGQVVKFEDQEVTIVKRFKGGSTGRTNYHWHTVPTGIIHRPCTYLLSNGYRVRGSILRKYNPKTY